jgi:hypothetical protein
MHVMHVAVGHSPTPDASARSLGRDGHVTAAVGNYPGVISQQLRPLAKANGFVLVPAPLYFALHLALLQFYYSIAIYRNL